MFYKVVLQRTVTVSPMDLSATLHRRLLTYLRDAVENKPVPAPDSNNGAVVDYRAGSKSSAVVIAVLDILNAKDTLGKVLDDGNVSFCLTYEALVLKLHRDEVLDLPVCEVNESGFYVSVFGVSRMFISRSQMSQDDMGFVSDGEQPQWTFDADGTAWIAADDLRSIRQDTLVRVRVVAETPQSQWGMAVGTMAGPFLGPRVLA